MANVRAEVVVTVRYEKFVAQVHFFVPDSFLKKSIMMNIWINWLDNGYLPKGVKIIAITWKNKLGDRRAGEGGNAGPIEAARQNFQALFLASTIDFRRGEGNGQQ